ncbi:hypothetical protein GRS48_11730 [Halorubrum sp. JWXQ-INN 858]|uniref:hypothetical protein n=1 Tax=Halorubrum sp. JWXQ-INN 858 TaxID=2690782 RepID=UPI00135C4CC8|nr:hypothetical protein [Halorubrum sp. JWXQ-INN 858]MWV65481.1 hypothetical protein [Halorubrum sp. JWXQ-INN 858]
MPRDFTQGAYAALLDAALDEGYEFLTVRDYLRRTDLPDRFLIVRHDVDRKPGNALSLARIETLRGVETTYYVRTVDSAWDPAIVRRLAELGHEVGYHYEDLDRADGDPRGARESFASNLARVRRLVDVDTVCMHGNPLTSHDNRDLWNTADLDAFGLLGEAYLSMDFTDVTYFSDTGRTWEDGVLKVKDHTMGEGEKRVSATSTWDLIGLLRGGEVDRACLLVHPERWTGSYPEYLSQRTKDLAVNVAKHGIQAVR